MNIFKSQQKKQQELVQQIHDEFDSAQERLLCQAEEILKSLSIPKESEIEGLAERLENIGFVKTPVNQKAKSLKESREKNKAVLVKTKIEAEIIQYYKHNYPFLKFLTESELNRICNKYGLVYASVSSYKETVPEKNLRDIEMAQGLREGDGVENTIKIVPDSKYKASFEKLLSALGKTDSYFTFTEQAQILENSYGRNVERWQLYIDSDMWMSTVCQKYTIPRIYDFTVESVDRSGLFIAAPESHFDLKGKQKEGLGYFSVTKIEVKDPIVFRYVRGGVQVLTKWGLEAEDPELFVDRNN